MVQVPKAPAGASQVRVEADSSSANGRSRAEALSALALETLEGILRGEGGDAAKIAAAREVLDRTCGKTKSEEKAAGPKTVTVVIRRFGDDQDGSLEPKQ